MGNKRAIARLRKLCLALPQVEERPFGGHTAPCWRVREKLFVTTAADESWMTCKARPGAQQALVGSDPDRFFVPRYTGKSGWIGIRLDGTPDWDEIAELLEESYRMTAPKKLVAEIEETPRSAS
jgi:predicted DNA-binding protein (MmcQ/YjbR family)